MDSWSLLCFEYLLRVEGESFSYIIVGIGKIIKKKKIVGIGNR